jgi:hypothetical protein
MKLAVPRVSHWLALVLYPAVLAHCGGATGLENADSAGSGSQAQASAESNAAGSTGSRTTLAPRIGSSSGVGTAMGASGTDTTNTAVTPSDSCSALEMSLYTIISTELSAGDKSCRTDSDCVESDGATHDCFYGCSGWALSASGAKAAEASIALQVAPLCSELAECPGRGPSGCAPIPSTLECNGGTCQRLALEDLSCDDLANHAAARLSTSLGGADRSCKRDADCALYTPHLSCVADCSLPAAVANTAMFTLPDSIFHVQRDVCDAFDARSCAGPAALPCPSGPTAPRATCFAGQCTVSSTLSP